MCILQGDACVPIAASRYAEILNMTCYIHWRQTKHLPQLSLERSVALQLTWQLVITVGLNLRSIFYLPRKCLSNSVYTKGAQANMRIH